MADYPDDLLSPCLYRLEAIATLTTPPAQSSLVAHLEGDLLQIH